VVPVATLASVHGGVKCATRISGEEKTQLRSRPIAVRIELDRTWLQIAGLDGEYAVAGDVNETRTVPDPE
jgi:hypothetical protein